MSRRAQDEDWDLTPVIDLIYSLSFCGDRQLKLQVPESAYPERPYSPAIAKNASEQVPQLGNFDRIWQYLGQPIDQSPPNVPTAPDGACIEILEGNSCENLSSFKAVKWRDELEGADLADNDENYDPQDLSKLTKAQRKKARRRQRQKDRAEALASGQALPSGSEDESGKDVQAPQTPDRKAIIHEILYGKPTPETATGRLRSGKLLRLEPPTDSGAWPVASPHLTKNGIQVLKPQKDSVFTIAAAKKAKLIAMLTETFIDDRQYLSNISFIHHVGTTTDFPADGIHVFVDASNVSLYHFNSLFCFVEPRRSHLADEHDQIMIGFHDALKLSRGQSLNQRIRRQPISFHNLSLILERGRPTTKRIIAGSDNFPAISEAKTIGYETNILDRVHKAKELTPRQRKFIRNGNGTGTGSGSETTAAAGLVQYAPEKWVEQAVDEILHLKMMESIVDANEPSIMVLATGDAAEAEYSGGFLKMVERALGKGWRVELACFKHNMSGAYKRREFRQLWGGRFKIVELDDFVEVLLGSE